MENVVRTIEDSDGQKFEMRCEELLNEGFEMKAYSCGFVQSEKYDFCAYYQAVFVKYSNEKDQRQ